MDDQQDTKSKLLKGLVAGVVLAVLLSGAAFTIALSRTSACGSDGRVHDEAFAGPAETPVESPPRNPVELIVEPKDNALVYGIRGLIYGGSKPVDCQIMVVVYTGMCGYYTESVCIIAEGAGPGGESRRIIALDEFPSWPIGAMIRLYTKERDDQGREYRLLEEKYVDLRRPYEDP